MPYSVAGVFHLYFGDARKHPIIGNYLRSLPDLPQRIVVEDAPVSRFPRLLRVVRDLWRIRRKSDWALHCHDFISGVLGGMLWKGRVIYDSHEIYSSFARRASTASLISMMEDFAIRRADITVFPSTYRSEYYNLDGRDYRLVENFYYPYSDSLPSRSGRQSTGFTFVYTGLFTPARAIDDIIDAFRCSELSGSRLLLAGKRTDYLESLLRDIPKNVEYLGELDHEQIPSLLTSADAGFALYRPINENNKRCAPTKVFEFLYFGLRVIANSSPYLNEIRCRPGGNLITTVERITPESIASACMSVIEIRDFPYKAVPDSVCWESQLPTIKSLYR